MSKYKEKNGTTRVGDFLRSINFKDVASVVGNVATGNFTQVIKTLTSSKELTQEQIDKSLQELEYDMREMEEVTKRWESDNKTESYLTKNIRPLTLAFLTATLFIYIILDSSLKGFSVDSEWVSLLKGLMMLAYGGYFGVRSVEKVFKINNDRKS